MTKFIVFYWEPGSGGDMVQNILLTDDNFSGVVKQFDETEFGRYSPVLDEFYKQSFPGDKDRWYFRQWSKEECNILIKINAESSKKYFIIPTHLPEQVEFMKLHLNCITMGITYPKNMFPIVLKNWCKKVAHTEDSIRAIYSKHSFGALKEKGMFSKFILTEQLRFGSNIKKTVENIFDIEINLENLYNNDLSDIEQLTPITQNSRDILQTWLSAQSEIPQHRYDILPELECALGFNSKITTLQEDITLDIFDNILIKHHFKNHSIPFFKTLKETNNFIKNLNCDNYI